MSWLDAPISVYRDAWTVAPDRTATIAQVLEEIRRGDYRQQVTRLQELRTVDAERYRREKARLPGATFGGTFSTRKNSALLSASGVLVVDLDNLEDLDAIRLIVETDPHTGFSFVSPSGAGLKVAVRIDPARYRESFEFARDYFRHELGVAIDEACKDVARLCFLSWDEGLFVNDQATPLDIPESAPVRPALPTNGYTSPSNGHDARYTGGHRQLGTDEVRELLAHIPRRPDYPTWIRVIAAVASELPEATAEMVLKDWSPEEHEGEYAEKIRHRLTDVHMGTLVLMAKERGWQPRREEYSRPARAYADPRPDPVPPHDDQDVRATDVAIEPPPPAVDLVTADGTLRPLTDLGNAERLVSQHGRDIRYIYAWNKWLAWDGHRWMVDETGEVERQAKATVRTIYEEAADGPTAADRKRIATWAKSSESLSRIRAMTALAASEPGVAVLHQDLDQDPWKINVNNGTLDLRTGNLLAHERQDLITKMAPVIYDPNATCPHWLDFLRQILQDSEDLIRFIARALGYALTGMVNEQALFFLYGSGANGKSTLLDVVLAILGDYGVQAPPGLLMAKYGDQHPTEMATLFRRRMAVCHEVEQGRRMAEETVKQLTGGDRISTRRMREDWWEFDPTHKIFLAANHKPRIKGTDFAIWRRIHLIPFTVSIPKEKQDPNLRGKLLQERSGILNWMLEGCLEWQEEGLGTPAEVVSATEAYRMESDLIGAFLSDRCQINSGLSCPAKALYDAYVAWCQSEGEKAITKTAFGLSLTERGIGEGRTPSQRIRTGIALNDLFSPANDAF